MMECCQISTVYFQTKKNIGKSLKNSVQLKKQNVLFQYIQNLSNAVYQDILSKCKCLVRSDFNYTEIKVTHICLLNASFFFYKISLNHVTKTYFRTSCKLTIEDPLAMLALNNRHTKTLMSSILRSGHFVALFQYCHIIAI